MLNCVTKLKINGVHKSGRSKETLLKSKTFLDPTLPPRDSKENGNTMQKRNKFFFIGETFVNLQYLFFHLCQPDNS